MNVWIKALAAVAVAVSVAGCDEGDIPETVVAGRTDTRSAHFAGRLTGVDTWGAGYSVVLAGFANSGDYALISKDIGSGEGDGMDFDVTLNGVPAEVTSVELCVINRLRQRVATVCVVAMPADAGFGDPVELPAGTYDCGMASAVQSEIFDPTCAQCHGGANYAAAGLYLTAGRSYAELVNVASVKEPDAVRVVPGNSGASLLYQILSTNSSAVWNYDHSVEVVDPVKLDLIRDWIDFGAMK